MTTLCAWKDSREKDVDALLDDSSVDWPVESSLLCTRGVLQYDHYYADSYQKGYLTQRPSWLNWESTIELCLASIIVLKTSFS